METFKLISDLRSTFSHSAQVVMVSMRRVEGQGAGQEGVGEGNRSLY
jgi:hypothetical protein